MVALCVCFLLTEVDQPLFYSNQNTWLLHAFADSGWAHVDEDWLATTSELEGDASVAEQPEIKVR